MIKKKAIWLGLTIWIIITVVFSTVDAPSDGFTSVGFPLHFYSYIEGKVALGSWTEVGFILTNFLIDFIALLAFIILFSIFLLNRRKQLKTS
ncbi:hypothetical protein [Mucilaginibacter lappiensis]|jgi:hypothetical protein|uniref:hypothetical protein n=1 Tax=Mucilaginibacter lappiensis TaxID=354630 RepID=UPI003D2310F7